MDDETLLERIGMTENEAEVRAVKYESDAWDFFNLGKPQHGKPSMADDDVEP